MQAETFDFQVETRQLLQLVINSIYSNKDLFLRELISNSSDALDKVRLERFHHPELAVDTSDLHIQLETDPEQRTLTITDNGIGMSREEVVGLIGKIAKSGTASFLEELRSRNQDEEIASEELIGRFGIGFYSSFMVADNVVLTTRRAGEAEATRWESNGEGTYTLQTLDEAPQGTSITLHLKPADPDDRLFDYTEPWRVKEIVRTYSDFVSFPIRMQSETGDEQETVNSRQALWAQPASEVSEAEYAELYKHLSHDWSDPLETIRLSIEGTLQYQALLFLPEHASPDLFSRGSKRGVRLYANRVFVMDDCEALMPNYLRFVKGVVDSADLALNVSREILQQDRQIEGMRSRLTKKILTTVKDMASKAPEKYATFWNAFGRAFKEGLLEDKANQERILEACSFESTHDPERPTSLIDYVERMGEREEIYYATGETRAAIENSPSMEAFTAKGLEVLLLTDPIDEVWVDTIDGFKGKKLQSVAKGEINLDEGSEEEREQQKDQFAALLPWLTTILDQKVKDVRLSNRLTSSPAVVVGDTYDASPALINMYKAMGQHIPEAKRILELNPAHPLVQGLREAHAERPDDERLAQTAELLYGMALMADGSPLDDPAHFVQLMATHLAKSLN